MSFARSSIFAFVFVAAVCFSCVDNLLKTEFVYKRYTRRRPTNYTPDKYLTEVYEIFHTKRMPPQYPFLTVGDLNKFIQCDRQPNLPDCNIFGTTERPQRTSTMFLRPETTTTSSPRWIPRTTKSTSTSTTTTRATTRWPATTTTTRATFTTRSTTTTTTRAPTTTRTTTTTREPTTIRTTTTSKEPTTTTSTKEPDKNLLPLLPQILDDDEEDFEQNGSGDYKYEENSPEKESENEIDSELYFAETTTTPKPKSLFNWF